jgi:lipopolysaccharide transport system permease protein
MICDTLSRHVMFMPDSGTLAGLRHDRISASFFGNRPSPPGWPEYLAFGMLRVAHGARFRRQYAGAMLMTTKTRRLYAYRHLILAIFFKDLQSRYVGSLFGPLWLIAQPLVLVFLYTIIFAQIMRNRLPGIDDEYGYSAFLCAGILVWNLFVEVLQRGKNVFIENANLIKKINFPKIALFIPVLFGAGFNFLLMFVIFVLFALILGIASPASIVFVVPPTLIAAALAMALGIVTAMVNVFVRDVGQLVDSLLQFGFWMTPIVYPISILPDWAAYLMGFNPLANLVLISQNAMTGQAIPWDRLFYPFGVALAAIALAVVFYRKGQLVLADHL